MWYSYYMGDSGEWVKSKSFETKEDFYDYAYKHPKSCFVLSSTPPDFLGRSYSVEIEKLNELEMLRNEYTTASFPY